MTETLTGRYFFPGSSRCVPARAMLKDDALRIEETQGSFLLEAPLSGLQISPRLGNLPRRFVLAEFIVRPPIPSLPVDTRLERSTGSSAGTPPEISLKRGH